MSVVYFMSIHSEIQGKEIYMYNCVEIVGSKGKEITKCEPFRYMFVYRVCIQK